MGIMQVGGRREGRDSERRRQGRARSSPGRYVRRLFQRLTTAIAQDMDMLNGEKGILVIAGLVKAARIQCRSRRPALIKG